MIGQINALNGSVLSVDLFTTNPGTCGLSFNATSITGITLTR
jgi:hypothetical protein